MLPLKNNILNVSIQLPCQTIRKKDYFLKKITSKLEGLTNSINTDINYYLCTLNHKIMNVDFVFSIANAIVLPQWLLMVLAPRWKWTQWLMHNHLIPTLLGLVYAFYLLSGIEGLDVEAFGTLEGVMKMFSVKEAVLIGWVHYLAFDLLIGTWILKEGQARNISHLWLAPCLLFCFMFGPVGWVIFKILCLRHTSNDAPSV